MIFASIFGIWFLGFVITLVWINHADAQAIDRLPAIVMVVASMLWFVVLPAYFFSKVTP